LHVKIGAGLGVVSLLKSRWHKCIADATTAEQRVSTTEPGSRHGAKPILLIFSFWETCFKLLSRLWRLW